MDVDECPICRDGPIGVKKIRDFMNRRDGKIRDLEIYYSMTTDEVYHHIEHHYSQVIKTKDPMTGIIKREFNSSDDIIDEFGGLYTIARNILEKVNEEINQNGLDGYRIDQLNKLTITCNNTLTKISEITGRLKRPGETEVNILQVEGNLNLMLNAINSLDFCDECDKKLEKVMENIKLLN